MNDPPSRLGRSLGRTRVCARLAEAPLARGAPNSSLASVSGGSVTPEDGGTGDNVDCEPWVREKVLFLLHPERRWLGSQEDPGRQGADAPQERGCPSPPFLSPERIPGSRGADSQATSKSVLVRVVDYQVTQELLQSAWTRGQMTRRTEERTMTAFTFRTNRE
ncbi:uncharacterized protein C6orf141 homolog [Suncus etruscus]|uniref:uncharacterized protein C6orf141 homolog n=1 Tax=Suncus etruscus TaxID=109475 RepID=UPI0021104764|nr:uncharacterized protein C6orf141 homolog [Suncus etruscus]